MNSALFFVSFVFFVAQYFLNRLCALAPLRES